jgi:hypothetical protein
MVCLQPSTGSGIPLLVPSSGEQECVFELGIAETWRYTVMTISVSFVAARYIIR